MGKCLTFDQEVASARNQPFHGNIKLITDNMRQK